MELPTGGSAGWALRQRLPQGAGFPKIARGGQAPSCQVRLRPEMVGTQVRPIPGAASGRWRQLPWQPNRSVLQCTGSKMGQARGQMLFPTHPTLPHPVWSPGHQRHRAGLSAAAAHGLPQRPAPAHAGLLAEGPQPQAQVRPDRQHAGQDDPQPQQPQSHGASLLWVGPHPGPGPSSPAGSAPAPQPALPLSEYPPTMAPPAPSRHSQPHLGIREGQHWCLRTVCPAWGRRGVQHTHCPLGEKEAHDRWQRRRLLKRAQRGHCLREITRISAGDEIYSSLFPP